MNFLMLGEGPTFGINGSIGASGKKIDISFLVKQRQNLAWVCVIMLIIVTYS